MIDTTYITKQVALEEEAFKTSLDKYENYFSKAIENGSIAESKEVILIIKVMIDSLSTHIQEFYDAPVRGRNREAQELFKDIAPNTRDFAFLLITSILRPLFRGKQKVLSVANKLKGDLERNRAVIGLRKQAPKLHSYIEQTAKTEGLRKKNLTRTAINMANKEDKTGLAIGSICIDLIIQSGCNLVTVYKEGSTNYIEFSKDTKELIMRSKVFFGKFITAYYPLIAKPKPWKELIGSGGYYTYDNIPFIKAKTTKDMNYLVDLKPDLGRLYDVVNKVSETPYRINTRMLNVINTIIKHRLVDHRSSATNPVLYGDIPYMDIMVATELIVKEDYGDIGSDGKFVRREDKIRWLKAIKEQEDRIIAIESKRLQYKLALQVAERFKNEEAIYFSYQLDFRGRLYPMQQFLHPQTSSNIKPLLEFADGKPLNKIGLYWLKVHGANCYGYDKLTYSERIAKIEEMEADIIATAKDPIGKLRFWYDTDSPLQFLSFCFSYSDYLEDNTTPIHIGVALDATCSGLQMYSGLLRDKKGSKCVNVINSDVDEVSDIYGDVATLVNKFLRTNDYPQRLQYTTKDGVEHDVPTMIEARSIVDKIDRKLTKRNVMTQPYSVTERGMYEQVYDLLTEYEDNNKKFWEGEKFIVATLLSKLNGKAIGEIVKGAYIGQRTLKTVLKKALESTNEALWYTPLFKFPVLQRIFREKRERLRTPLGQLVLYHPTKKVHYLKMLNGIAPNFIHSLDATLLYRTVEMCIDKGVDSFWLIHDSYGVHPNDTATLNECFRKAYVELFKNNPLQQWVNQILPEASELVDKVMVNDLDLDDVLKSRYIIC